MQVRRKLLMGVVWGEVSQRYHTMETLHFINPAILERLQTGTFVPERRSKSGSLTLSERRDTVSPLAVAKRCIRYDPLVFQNRTDLVIQMAEALNDPVHKMLMVTGPQGSGKTSLVRALVEMLGGGPEQLLWFDINVHADFDEITQFLIRYVTYICTARNIPASDPGLGGRRPRPSGEGAPSPPTVSTAEARQDVLDTLRTHLESVADLPLLIVIDNLEYIVDPEYQIQSFAFKEILNFLLSFPNIKMLLLGERLPYGDISVDAEVVTEIKVAGLSPQASVPVLQDHLAEETVSGEVCQSLVRLSGGMPWQLRSLNTLARFEIPLALVAETAQAPGKTLLACMTEEALAQLDEAARQIVTVLCCLRHPVDVPTLRAVLAVCAPGVATEVLQQPEASLIRMFLKKLYPPQVVLRQIRTQLEHPSAETPAGRGQPNPWFEIGHRQIRKILYHRIPETERQALHTHLQAFYQQEKDTPLEERTYRIKTNALTAEAAFHAGMARKQQAAPAMDSSLKTKSYMYQNVNPSNTPRVVTLEDVRKVSIPDPPVGPEVLRPGKATAVPPISRGGEGPAPAAPLPQGESVRPLPPVAGGRPRSEASPPRPPVYYDPVPGDRAEDPYLGAEELAEEFSVEEEASFSEASAPVPDWASVLEGELVEDPAQEEGGGSGAFEDSSKTGPSKTPLDKPPLGYEPDEAERSLQRKLAAAVANRNKPEMLVHLIELARYRAGRGLFQNAEECLDKAKALQADATSRMLADIDSLLGHIYKETFRHGKALAHLLKGIERTEALLNPDATAIPLRETPATYQTQLTAQLAQAYQDLGEIGAHRSQWADAARHFHKAWKYYSQLPEPQRQSETCFRLAEALDHLHHTERALQYYEKALALETRPGNPASVNHGTCAAILANMGAIYLEAGRLEQAVTCLEASLGHDRQIENREGEFNTLELMATGYRKLGNWHRAEESYLQALRLAQLQGDPYWLTSAHMSLGNLFRLKQQWPQALEHYQAALHVAPAEVSEKSKAFLSQKIQEATHHVQSPRPDAGGTL